MPLLAVIGPTATGKSKLAIELAKEINGEIISDDSMQVYRGMDIGTAKPTEKEKQGVAHYLIDIRNPDESWTVADFIAEFQTSNLKIQNKKKETILVGGTGLYLWSLFEGYSFPDAPSDKTIRDKLAKIDSAKLYAQLSQVDPDAAKKIHPNNKKRVIRALEVFELTGKPISQLHKTRITGSPDNRITKLIGLNLPREGLYQRINSRVDQMIEQGLIDEVKGLLAKGYAKDLISMQGLGYKEVIEYLDGNWDKDKMIEELKKRTRHFAKRQMTWFKRFKDVKWFEPKDKDQILQFLSA